MSAIAHITVLGVYSQAIFKRLRTSLILVGLMLFIFAYIFILLQQEDFALMVGAISLFVFLSIFMIATRKIDWYNLKRGREEIDAMPEQ